MGPVSIELHRASRVPERMRIHLIKLSTLCLLTAWSVDHSHAQDAQRFGRALMAEDHKALDRWMKRELHHKRKGTLVSMPSGNCVMHHATFDSLASWLRRQPGVDDAGWDRCATKIAIWPGHSTIGLRWRTASGNHERCYLVQEGRHGAVRLLGMRFQLRRNREILVHKGAHGCTGFVEEQRRICAEEER